MKKLIALVVLSLFISPIVVAKPPADKDKAHTKKVVVVQKKENKQVVVGQKKNSKKIVVVQKKDKMPVKSNKSKREKVISRDPLLPTDAPPGLKNKGQPPGLAKKDKVPPGWSEGEKRGWEDKGFFRSAWDRFLGFFK
ncbi:hypothetical protein [Aquicella lusitana]|uniref:Uncharacterized protein n=1 Tax=Aquicella lusitana TaxID=254246 RepID=A0A370GHI3_9COXI|nr:hypothetical protein [Aquicella lusitana]RDI42706.1 hypothetical protein C8D86_11335 [Aquicella lusitana]VVC73439.1 hypothetical protein AQULUS_11790 [Aquicella lusitana]